MAISPSIAAFEVRTHRWSGALLVMTLIYVLCIAVMFAAGGYNQYPSAYGTILFHVPHIIGLFMFMFFIWNLRSVTIKNRIEQASSIPISIVMLIVLCILDVIYIIRTIIDLCSCGGSGFCTSAFGLFITLMVMAIFLLVLEIIMVVLFASWRKQINEQMIAMDYSLPTNYINTKAPNPDSRSQNWDIDILDH